tara:strand:- start:63 stop:908 length:846 start_codon:yes stop_codon:yes gene_type:complete
MNISTITLLTFVFIFAVLLKYKNIDLFFQNKQSIPKIIHKVYIEHSMKLPTELSENLKKAHESWTLLNPGYKMKFYSGDDCIKYLQQHFGSEYVDIFNNINAYAGKCNFFRMCVVYNEGGWYSDWKQMCLKPIHEWVHKDLEFVGFYDPYWNLETVKKKCGQNATFGSIPKHPILKKTIDLIKDNVKNKYYGKGALYTTGVCVYGRAIHETLPKLKSNSYQFGSYIHNYNGYPYMTMNNIKVIQHKCKSCDVSQDWENGNNYFKLWEDRNYYGEKENVKVV